MEREEVVVYSGEVHVPDSLSRPKDITLVAPIGSHCAETIKPRAVRSMVPNRNQR
jgi:hypothetical protein